ncbi:MAG: DNA mismatch repair endonuclease MutL [Bacteroidales bacterium]|jgi:DNA mismatch repair protein MutL
MPDLIKLLPDSVANQIAAGEVIQRPASVVKELVENAVDAGAKTISVVIKDSGKTLIQVVDDGTGMSETDARLAFERHATSKINSAQDLFAIRTKGFRGEALASIAAVSMVELRTRKPEEETGTLIQISGSKVTAQEPCGSPEGSNFAVKNLFFNVPARRKFLKSDNTEMRHIITEFQKIVIPHPEIRFLLYHNDSEIYNLPPSNLRQRIIGVFGKQINNELIRIETDTTIIRVNGFVGKPENARKTYGEQFFFVNDRFMKHPYFHKAVMEAYRNILVPDAIPSYFIFMEADPDAIDVNIHPTKTEIKFENEQAIWPILLASVKEALGRFNIVPSLDFRSEIMFDIPVKSGSSGIPAAPEIRTDPAYNPFSGENTRKTKAEIIERFNKENIRGWEKLYYPPGDNDLQPIPSDPERRLLQIKGKYLVSPVKSGLMLIDQKRAHERILYERYLETTSTRGGISQAEMFPVRIEMNPADYLLLLEIKDEIAQLGFKIEYPDNTTIISLTGRPSDTQFEDPAELIEILLEEYKSTQADPSEGMKEKVAAALASAAAIPYGKVLSKMEMEDIIDNLFACKAPNYSPKGKAVISIITMEDIDKRFR